MLVAAFCLVVETTTRWGYGRISRIRRQNVSEYLQARRAGGHTAYVLVGNSLLKEGVDMQALQQAVGKDMPVQRFAVESTTYWDWYYGLRHLFSHGARPNTVIVVMSARQWLAGGVRGEYSAGLMLDRGDVLKMASDVGTSNTVTSSILFSTYSSYYANRAEIRKWLMGLAIPGFQSFTAGFAPPTPPLPGDDEILARVAPRIAAVRDLCANNGVRLAVVVPPTNLAKDGSEAMRDAGRRAGVPVLIPVQERELSPVDYSDGFHLNQQGRTIFTAALASRLAGIRVAVVNRLDR